MGTGAAGRAPRYPAAPKAPPPLWTELSLRLELRSMAEREDQEAGLQVGLAMGRKVCGVGRGGEGSEGARGFSGTLFRTAEPSPPWNLPLRAPG